MIPKMRLRAIYEIGVTGHPDSRPHLSKSLEDPNPEVGATAAHYLARLNPDGLVGRMESKLDSENAAVRRNAALALGYLQSAEAVDILLIALSREQDEAQKRALIEALGESGRKEAIPGLKNLAARENEFKEAAKKALDRIANES